jgi:hypothetical protein
MKPSQVPDEVREAIHEAMAALDDESRELVIEHYFEKESLDAMGLRRGLTGTAIWKRIENAKRRLREALIVAGFGTVAQHADACLESAMATPPANLMTSSVIAKAAVIGGTAYVGTKTALSTGAVIVGILLVGLGLTGAIWWRRTAATREANRTPFVNTDASRSSKSREPEAPLQKNIATTPDMEVPDSGTATPPIPISQQLRDRLARFKAWRRKANEDRRAHLKPIPDSEAEGRWDPGARERWRQGNREELAGLRDLILEAPEEFVAFVRDPANADCMIDLLEFTLSKLANPGGFAYFGQKYADFPPVLLDGLHEAMLTADAATQRELLRFFEAVQDVPETYLDRYRALMASGDPLVRAAAAAILIKDRRVALQDLQAVQIMANLSEFKASQHRLTEALTMCSSPSAETWFLDQLSTAPDDLTTGKIVNALGRRAMFGLASSASSDPVYASMMALLQRPQNVTTQWTILRTVVYQSPERIQELLQRFELTEAQEACKKAAGRLLQAVKEGERKPIALAEIIHSAEQASYRR